MITHKLHTRLLLITSAMVLGLSACSNDMSDLHDHVKKARSQKKTKVPALPVILPVPATRTLPVVEVALTPSKAPVPA